MENECEAQCSYGEHTVSCRVLCDRWTASYLLSSGEPVYRRPRETSAADFVLAVNIAAGADGAGVCAEIEFAPSGVLLGLLPLSARWRLA